MGMLVLLGCILLLCPNLVRVLMLLCASNVSYGEASHRLKELTGREVGDEFIVDQNVLIVVAGVIIIHVFALYQ